MHGYRAISTALSNWKSSFGDFVRQLDEDGVPYVSYTKLSCVESCELRYLLEYVERVEFDEPLYFTKGKVFHDAASLAYQQLGQGQGDPRPILQIVNKHNDDEDQTHLMNAINLLLDNQHQGYEVVATELPFVLSLGARQRPLLGVIDLLLRKGDTFLVVDHKTGKSFYDQDAFQLDLYREHVRRAFKPRRCLACFDEYRWVNSLDRIRKPAFRRTPVTSRPWSSSLRRIHVGLTSIRRIERNMTADSDGDCFRCHLRTVCPQATRCW